MKMKNFIIPVVLVTTLFYIGQTMSEKADDNYRQYVQSLEEKYPTKQQIVEKQRQKNVEEQQIVEKSERKTTKIVEKSDDDFGYSEQDRSFMSKYSDIVDLSCSGNRGIMSTIGKMLSYYEEKYPTHVTIDIEVTENDNYHIFEIYLSHKRQKTTLQTFYVDKVCRRIGE